MRFDKTPYKQAFARVRQALMRLGRRRLALGGLVALGAGVGLYGYAMSAVQQAPSAEADMSPPVTVLVARAEPTSEARPRRFAAVVQPSTDTAIAFQVAGRISQGLVGTGSMIRKGQELARLDPQDFELARIRAAAEVTAAKHALLVAQEEAARVSALKARGNAPVARLQTVQAAEQEASSRLAQAQAQLEAAQNALGYTSLRAENDGLVLEKLVEPGQVISAGQTIFRVAPVQAFDVQAFDAVAALPENIPLPKLGAKAQFVPWSRPDLAIPCTLREISPIADTTTHTFEVHFALKAAPEALDALRYGMSGHLILPQSDTRAAQIRLPSSAIYHAGASRGAGVWRVSDAGRLVFVPVQIHRLEGAQTLVSAPLTRADRIVRLGVNRLRDGMRVVVSPEKTPEGN